MMTQLKWSADGMQWAWVQPKSECELGIHFGPPEIHEAKEGQFVGIKSDKLWLK